MQTAAINTKDIDKIDAPIHSSAVTHTHIDNSNHGETEICTAAVSITQSGRQIKPPAQIYSTNNTHTLIKKVRNTPTTHIYAYEDVLDIKIDPQGGSYRILVQGRKEDIDVKECTDARSSKWWCTYNLSNDNIEALVRKCLQLYSKKYDEGKWPVEVCAGCGSPQTAGNKLVASCGNGGCVQQFCDKCYNDTLYGSSTTGSSITMSHPMTCIIAQEHMASKQTFLRNPIQHSKAVHIRNTVMAPSQIIVINTYSNNKSKPNATLAAHDDTLAADNNKWYKELKTHSQFNALGMHGVHTFYHPMIFSTNIKHLQNYIKDHSYDIGALSTHTKYTFIILQCHGNNANAVYFGEEAVNIPLVAQSLDALFWSIAHHNANTDNKCQMVVIVCGCCQELVYWIPSAKKYKITVMVPTLDYTNTEAVWNTLIDVLHDMVQRNLPLVYSVMRHKHDTAFYDSDWSIYDAETDKAFRPRQLDDYLNQLSDIPPASYSQRFCTLLIQKYADALQTDKIRWSKYLGAPRRQVKIQQNTVPLAHAVRYDSPTSLYIPEVLIDNIQTVPTLQPPPELPTCHTSKHSLQFRHNLTFTDYTYECDWCIQEHRSSVNSLVCAGPRWSCTTCEAVDLCLHHAIKLLKKQHKDIIKKKPGVTARSGICILHVRHIYMYDNNLTSHA